MNIFHIITLYQVYLKTDETGRINVTAFQE